MNHQRLLTILLVGMMLSACAQIEHYRTQTLDEQFQPKVFECRVDRQAPGTQALCEHQSSFEPDTHASDAHSYSIQHRFYQTGPTTKTYTVTDQADIGRIDDVKGTVHIERNGEKITDKLVRKILKQSDKLVTGADGRVKVTLLNKLVNPNQEPVGDSEIYVFENSGLKTEKKGGGDVVEVKVADRTDGDYYLSFVEFDDQGWFADRTQMEALFKLLKELEDSGEEILIYVYAHGWKHNASACDDNVVCFSRLLERTDLAEKGAKLFGGMMEEEINTDVKPRNVVGIYLGWRGLPFDTALNNVSFWSRKNTAARVGRGGVFELLTRLKDYRDNRQNGEADPKKTQLVITGHSFGGLVIYEALSHALMERAAKTTNVCGTTQYEVAKSFGDFVMLVNPAFEGSLYEPLFNIATNRCYDERKKDDKRGLRPKQKPVMMIVTSKADSDTGSLFPIGRTLGTLFQTAMSSNQKDSMRKTIGHNPRYVTHRLSWKPETCADDESGATITQTSDISEESSEKEKAASEKLCICKNLAATSDSTLEELLGPYYDELFKRSGLNFSEPDPNFSEPDPNCRYGQGVSLSAVQSPSPTYALNYPYLVVETDAAMIADHNAIYNDRFILFTQQFFIDHVIGSEPWDQVKSPTACWPKEKMSGGLVPFESSCQFGDGSVCTRQRKR